MDTTDTPTPPTERTPQRPRKRWPRRLAIGVAVLAVAIGGLVWYGGRETTLQMIAQRVASASGGKLTLTGVSGSLYGRMHVAHVVFRSETSIITADDVDIDWKPWQYLSKGVEIDQLHARVLQVATIKKTEERTPMPQRLAPPFQVAVEDARVDKLLFVDRTTATPTVTEIDAIRARLHGDKAQWKLDYANATTPWGQLAAGGTIANTLPYKLDADASLSQDAAKPGSIGAQLTYGNYKSTTGGRDAHPGLENSGRRRPAHGPGRAAGPAPGRRRLRAAGDRQPGGGGDPLRRT